MEKLHRQIRAARRRIILQRFVAALPWTVLFAFTIAALAIASQKWLLVGIDGMQWARWWLIGAACSAILATVTWIMIRSATSRQAAVEIDRRFDLDERISSAAALSPDELATPFGRALLADAVRQIERLDIGAHFPIRLQPRALLAFAPALLAAGLCFIADPLRSATARPSGESALSQAEIEQLIKPIHSTIEKQIQQAREKGLSDAAALMQKLAEDARQLEKSPPNDQHEALVQLSDLAKDLEARRGKLAEAERLKIDSQLLKDLPPGAAEQLARDLQSGDFDKAASDLEKLTNELNQSKFDPALLSQLAKQSETIANALDKLGASQQKLEQQLATDLQNAQKTGNAEAVEKLQRQLAKLAARHDRLEAFKKLSSKMGQCSACAGNCDGNGTKAALLDMESDFAQLDKEQQELAMVQRTLDELTDARLALANCQSTTASGSAMQAATQSQNSAIGGHEAGHGPGGAGVMPDPVTPQFVDEPARAAAAGPGSMVMSGFVDGPNAKGKAIEQIQNEVEAARREPPDAISNSRLPRAQRDHVQQYFEAIRKSSH